MTGGPTSGGRLAWAALSALDRDRSTPNLELFAGGAAFFPGGAPPFRGPSPLVSETLNVAPPLPLEGFAVQKGPKSQL